MPWASPSAPGGQNGLAHYFLSDSRRNSLQQCARVSFTKMKKTSILLATRHGRVTLHKVTRLAEVARIDSYITVNPSRQGVIIVQVMVVFVANGKTSTTIRPVYINDERISRRLA